MSPGLSLKFHQTCPGHCEFQGCRHSKHMLIYCSGAAHSIPHLRSVFYRTIKCDKEIELKTQVSKENVGALEATPAVGTGSRGQGHPGWHQPVAERGSEEDPPATVGFASVRGGWPRRGTYTWATRRLSLGRRSLLSDSLRARQSPVCRSPRRAQEHGFPETTLSQEVSVS